MLSFKKATLTTENETKDGVLVILEDDACKSLFPKTTFVPYDETVFFTKEAEQLNNILDKCKETMLEMMNVADLSIPFIDDYFFDEKLGLIINFDQQLHDQQNFIWTTSPVFIKLLDPIEWLNNWQGDKNVWIKAMLNKNPPEILKNKLIAYSL
jgi:hypothetical protein